MIDLRPAGAQMHIEPVAFVDTGRDRLIKAAMLGLRFPVRAEIDGFGGGGAERSDGCENRGGKQRGRDQCSCRSNHQITLTDLPAPVYSDKSWGSSIVPGGSRNPR